MLYILTALKCEAAALTGITCESFTTGEERRTPDAAPKIITTGEERRTPDAAPKIITTGAGRRASDAVAKIGLTANDFVLNAGICAGGEKGKGYLINQVISRDTGRRFYPDMVFEAGAEEMTLTTSSEIVTSVEDGMLYDMEAALICEEVLKVIPPSNLAIYKVVSDSGDKFPTANEVTALMRAHADEIKKIAILLCNSKGERKYEFLPEEIYQELRLTQYMRNELKDIEHYCVVSGREDELRKIFARMKEQGRIPVRDKKAGREVLDEIYSCLR